MIHVPKKKKRGGGNIYYTLTGLYTYVCVVLKSYIIYNLCYMCVIDSFCFGFFNLLYNIAINRILVRFFGVSFILFRFLKSI